MSNYNQSTSPYTTSPTHCLHDTFLPRATGSFLWSFAGCFGVGYLFSEFLILYFQYVFKPAGFVLNLNIETVSGILIHDTFSSGLLVKSISWLWTAAQICVYRIQVTALCVSVRWYTSLNTAPRCSWRLSSCRWILIKWLMFW